jgi:hypothetical protein
MDGRHQPLTSIERQYLAAVTKGSLNEIRQLFVTCTITRTPLGSIALSPTTITTTTGDSKSTVADSEEMISPFDDDDNGNSDELFISPFDDDTTLPAATPTSAPASVILDKPLLNIDVSDDKKYTD